MTEFEELPEGCISTILSCITPADAGRLFVVSKTFLSATDSDAVWNQFIPSDSHFMDTIISHSLSLANAPNKKALYLALSDRSIIIDNDQKSIQLKRKSGKNVTCLMLDLSPLLGKMIDVIGTGFLCMVPELLLDRSPEVAELLEVWWFDICGMINILALSPNTQYAAYLVFKMIDAEGFQNCPTELSVSVGSGHSSTKTASLDPNVEGIGSTTE